MKQTVSDLQKRRADNIIWTCAGDYSFVPDFKAYREDGSVDLYWNVIFGAARRRYDYRQLEGLFAVKNILEREKQWDRLYWQKADELTQFNLFDIDVVLAFLVKAHTVARWNALDPAHGAELFSQLVNEVRGTFSGVNYDPNTL